jgi:hypothetical protein
VRSSLGPFAFDAPGTWTRIPTGNPAHYETIFGFLAAPPATVSETCGPNYTPGGGSCNDTLATPDGSVLVSFRWFVNGACYPDAAGQLAVDLAAGWSATTVSGLAAAVDHPVLGDGATAWTWQLGAPGTGACDLYEVKASFGPKSASLGPAVDALVGSLKVTTAP